MLKLYIESEKQKQFVYKSDHLNISERRPFAWSWVAGLNYWLGSIPYSRDASSPEKRSFVPQNLIPVQGSPVPVLKFQMGPILKLFMSSG